MSTVSDPTLAPQDPRSSLLQRLSAEQRGELDRAIIDHEPASYRGMYKEFALGEFGISFTAFYRYARRIRLHAALQDAIEDDLPPGGDDPARLVRVLARRLWEALAHPDGPPALIARYFNLWRHALKVAGPTSRTEDPQRKEANAERRNTRALADLAQSMAVIAGYGVSGQSPEPAEPPR